jgi:hypothetical protein
MLAVIAILSLAAWLPIQAQQAASPAAPAAQAPATAAAQEDTSKAPAKHECCCAAKSQKEQGDTASGGQHAAGCCHGKDTEAAKADCCEGKSAKDTPCCGKNDKSDPKAMPCCAGMKEGQCPGKGGRCCSNMNAKDGKGCCGGMRRDCPAHANGK